MNQVITLADQIINSNNYQLTPSMFDNFTPNNDVTGKGVIFANQNFGGTLAGNIRSRWFCTLHYNQTPSGWNGFTTLSDFYDKYEAGDARRYSTRGDFNGSTSFNLGFLEGQQFGKLKKKVANSSGTFDDSLDVNGNFISAPLKDRKGNNLAFTRNVSLIETGNNLEITGIRVMKYIPDLGSGDNVNNDAVLIRYEDVLLMKAEAILRGGTATGTAPFNTALGIVNAIRQRSSASALGTVTLTNVYDERGREFAWEGLRRSDMIRFGRFLAPTQLRTAASAATRLLFPIPSGQLAVNPNLKQNPGYN
jgi:starch-binding outer membrane protein, SusD/RagB family